MSSAYANWHVGVADSDDDDDVGEDYKYTKQATLWAIEATDAMLAPTLLDAPLDPSDPTPTPTATATATARPTPSQAASVMYKGKPATSKMEECLRCAYSMMKRKVISSPKDLVGIMVWNTADARASSKSAFDNCHLLLGLEQVDAQNIRKMKEVLEQAEQDPEYLRNLFRPNPGQNIVAEMLGNCSTIFRECSPNSNNTIFLVTDNDDPVGDLDQLFQVARTKREDLNDMGYSIEPFLIPPTQRAQFDLNKFWGDILTATGEDDPAVNWPVVNTDLRASLDGMVAAMRTKEAAKRVAFKIPFVMGNGLSIGIAGRSRYNLVGEETKKLPTKVDLNTAAGEEVITKTVYKDSETGAELNPKKDIKKYFSVGHADYDRGVQAEKIFFSEQEVRIVKTIGRPPSLKLLGFKPRKDHLNFMETVKHSYFIYPDEERYTGSTRTFTALLRSMLKKDLVGYASFLARATGKPQVVLLLPQAEELNSAGVAIRPPGIHLCQLPFVDDMRDVALDSTVTVLNPPDEDDDEPEQPAVDIAKKIVSKYSKPYIPDSYPNPALNYFYDTLAAVALDEEIPEPDDKTIPSYEIIEKRIGSYIRDLRALIPQDEIDPSRLPLSTKKRPTAKKEPSGPPPDMSEFAADLRERGDKVKVDELKSALRSMGEAVGGKKAELRERAEAWLASHGMWDADADGERVEKEAESEEDVKPSKGKAGKKRRKVVVEEEEDDF
ncbi:hypothetical protein JCM10207_007252 [Rhodosporidiobolus poonsookiae]